MSRPAYDLFKDETLGQTPPKTRIRVDWKRGASMLAGGEPAAAVAAALGIAEERLWRHFNKSLRFQFLFRQALERNRLTAQLAFEEAGRRAVVQRCGRVDDLDADSLQWLARETGLTETGDSVEAHSSRQGRELRLAAALKDAGRLGPNQALHARIKRERKVMDAQFAELKAWGRSVGILPPAPPEAAPGADKPPAGDDRTQTAETGTQISKNKTQISESEIQISAGVPRTEAKPPQIPPAAPVPPATGAFQPHHYGSVIDLTDMEGNPLPGREHLLRE